MIARCASIEREQDSEGSAWRQAWSERAATNVEGVAPATFLCFFSCVFLCGSGISFCGTRAAFAVNLNWLAGRSSGS